MSKWARRCVYSGKSGDRCQNRPVERSDLCEQHQGCTIWDVVTSKIRNKARVSLPYEVRGVMAMMCELLGMLKKHEISPEEGKAAAEMADTMIEAIKVGIVQKEKGFERKCMIEDRRHHREQKGYLLPSPEDLERMTDRALGNVVDVEHEPTNTGTEN